MPNAWAQNWGSSLTGIGDDIGGFLKKKREEEEFQRLLGNALFQNKQGYAVNNPDGSPNPNQMQDYLGDGSEIMGTGDRSSARGGSASFQNYQSPRQDIFGQENYGNLMNLLKANPQVFSGLLQTDQMNQPKYSEYSPGAAIYKQQRGADHPQQIGQVPFRPPTPTKPNIDYIQLHGKDGLPHQWEITRDPQTQAEVSRRDLGVSGYKPSPAASMQPDKLMIDLTNRFNANEQVKRAQQMASNSSIANDILAGKNPIGDEAIKVFMARASGEVGNLSQSEQERYGGSKAILENVEQIAKTLQTGKLTDANRKYMKELADAFGRGGKRMLQRMAKDYSSQYSQNPLYGMDSDRMYKYLLPQSAREEEKDIDSVLIDSVLDEVFGKKK